MKKTILVAGATGNLGERIVKALINKGAEVRVIVRLNCDNEKKLRLEKTGATIYEVDMKNKEEMIKACIGVSCVVSALSGLRDVIIDTQKLLLDAAILAGVPRFIPSDYSLDFTKFSSGENRNLDWRREFHEYLDKSSISATTIFNGAFTDMLTGQMPLVLLKQKKILYWGNADSQMCFTTIDDTATYTANAALDESTPRFLRIAGDLISPRQICVVMNELSKEKFRLFRAGGPGLLSILIKVARTLAPNEKELYPAWQGMQYMRNMIDDRSKIETIDNDRYPDMKWKTAKEVLSDHLSNM